MGITYRVMKDAGIDAGISITGYAGEIRRLVIPPAIDGLWVRSAAPHALAERDDLEEIILPDTLRSLGAYCLHDCARLARISIYDSVEDYADGVIKGCRNLREIDVLHDTATDEAYRFLIARQMLADNDRQLVFHFLRENTRKNPDSATASSTYQEDAGDGAVQEDFVLVFPDYVYGFREDTMARAIHHKIEGAGYAYRETVTRRRIDFREYDKLFARVRADAPDAAAAIAVCRLMYPVELSPASHDIYADYIMHHEDRILDLICGVSIRGRGVSGFRPQEESTYHAGFGKRQSLTDRSQERSIRDRLIAGISDVDVVRFLTRERLVSVDGAGRAAAAASGQGDIQMISLLMDYAAGRDEADGGVSRRGTFTLSDL